MYLKKLELVGFKSIMEKTILHFDAGITAVVGPNGCGKSNIFDSIRWVLGEQSAKSLRGSQMEDVIFNGTDTKPALSLAEVTLTFDNSKRFFSVNHDEVAITRRIFRSGESEYLLNKIQIRLKDILDLLAGTGIGSEGYSLVEQGKIDLILSAKPEERRLVFDEASGITKYKTQKRETLRRLEETEQNLLRLNDITTEVKRQIGSLERQANKARRYKEVFEELKSKEIHLAASQKKELKIQKNQILEQSDKLQMQEAGLLNIVKDQESQINSCQQEVRALEENTMGIRNQISNLDNLIIRNRGHIELNHERLRELDNTKKYLKTQIEQSKHKLILDEEKLNNVKKEYDNINKNIEEKSSFLKDRESQLDTVVSSIKSAQDNITKAKKAILDLVSRSANVRNEISDLTAQQQIYFARKRRLEVERAKINEEKASVDSNLNNVTQELKGLQKQYQDLSLKISDLKKELLQESSSSNRINTEIEDLQRQIFVLQSQKDFLDKLKTRYEDITESMNAIIYLDKLPSDRVSGLVVKVKDYVNLNKSGENDESANFKLSGEAKPIDLDTQIVAKRIDQIQQRLDSLSNEKALVEERIKELSNSLEGAEQSLRGQEMVLVNKKAMHQAILDESSKIKEEQELIVIELSELEQELSVLNEKSGHLKSSLSELEKEQRQAEDLIFNEQGNITLNINLKEGLLVAITQVKTELDSLTKRIDSDEAALKILKDTYELDKENLCNLESQIKESCLRQESLAGEIKGLQEKINEAEDGLKSKNTQLKEMQDKYKSIFEDTDQAARKIDLDRKELDALKNKLYELQMQNKDVDFKILSMKERILQVYKVDPDTIEDISVEIDEGVLSEDIQGLKEKLDSYGTVNLVAIEEYDELKKRYDFLIQQQNDLNSAKESLHAAILKINRTTKKMFLETFQKVGEEFRNYFRLLFNGGDAQVFLIDEQDPLESGIEVICRPPGKKLQNVLLLSGGEKSLSAIALLFAIFKVKPAPFCVLDEIDAALDEANIDRFSRTLQDFSDTSQFIVITHNKKTIAHADVMYGITMEESGVSKIVSVKFGQKIKPQEDREPVAQSGFN
ncbi:MAG: AAA family ATPase [Candidatus Omnitrophica bacterium]|nr:AAA family ATPase [Candidatus Omnitrophota bacterium]